MEIQRLAPEVAAAIAAGEVIERPDSVVKELVENCIDSGATSVTIELLGGGLDAIKVSDNGCGIPVKQLPLAVERHTTSKVRALADLEGISTLGFRGEALASIASVAHLGILSRTPDDDRAWFLETHGGVISTPTVAAGPVGTTVEVKALFGDVPARLKFMNSSRTETSRVKRIIERLAISSPSIRFELQSDDKTVLRTSGNGNLRDVLASMIGPDSATSMIMVTALQEVPYEVWGLVSAPDRHRPNRSGLNFFMNGRWITDTHLAVAVEGAYSGLLMEGRFPFAALFLDIPPAEIDVNVHPNKREIRFLKERDAFTSLQRSVRESLLAAYPIAEARNLFPASNSDTQPFGPDYRVPAISELQLKTELETRQLSAPISDLTLTVVPGQKSPILRVLGQIDSKYIVADGPDGMCLIDQHAAHESTLYYQLMRSWDSAIPASQPMLDPLTVGLSPKEEHLVIQHADAIHKCGVTLEPFGDGTWLIREVPVMSRHVDPVVLLKQILNSIDSGQEGLAAFRVIAASLACHSAIRAGQKLDEQEMNRLIWELETRSDPQYCPHGRPTRVIVTRQALDRQFGRA